MFHDPKVSRVGRSAKALGKLVSWVTTTALVNLAVTTAKLANDAVTNAKMADNSVGTNELIDNAVTNAKMADNSVNTAELVDDAVTAAKLANMAQSTIKGRAAGAGTGDPTDLSVAQVQAVLGLASSTTDNAAIRADGTAGGTQNSGVIIDDSNNISGVGTLSLTSPGNTSITIGDATNALVAGWSDGGASLGPSVILDRNSSSPAAADQIGALVARGKSSAGTTRQYATIVGRILTTTDAAEDAEWRFNAFVSGTAVNQAVIGDGVQFGAPTGGYKGNGSLNAKDVYNDNVALTCMALAAEFFQKGKIDLNYWHSLVPDTVYPAVIERAYRKRVPVTRKVLQQKIEETTEGFVAKAIEVEIQETVPAGVWNEAGEGIGMIDAPLFEEVDVPEQVIEPERREKRQHKVAMIFNDMLNDGFDPRDPIKYIAKLKKDQALPGMPTRETWKHNEIGQGELFGRMWLALEMLAIVVLNHEERLAKLEAKK